MASFTQGHVSIGKRWWRRRRHCNHLIWKSYLGNLKLKKKKRMQEQRVQTRNIQTEGEKAHKSREKTSDSHQDRLSNQMGTIQEVGRSEWGGTLIG